MPVSCLSLTSRFGQYEELSIIAACRLPSADRRLPQPQAVNFEGCIPDTASAAHPPRLGYIDVSVNSTQPPSPP